MKNELVSVSQAAAIKGVSRNAVYKAVSDGRLPSSILVGVIALSRKDVDSWQPKTRTGRRIGTKTSEGTKSKISESQRRRWQKRKDS